MSKFDKVKEFYEAGLWSLEMVRNSVSRWISEKEYKAITGQKY